MFGIGDGGFGFKSGFGDFIGHGIDEASGNGGDTGNGARGVQNFLDECEGGFGSGKTILCEVETKTEEMIGLEAQVEMEELVEVAKGESSADEKNRGEGHFADDKKLVEEVVSRGVRLFRGIERGGWREGGGAKGGNKKVNDLRSYEPTLGIKREGWGTFKHFCMASQACEERVRRPGTALGREERGGQAGEEGGEQ
jgi:hypothetical protein